MDNTIESRIKTIVGSLPETIRAQMDQFSGRTWLWPLIQKWFAEGPEQIFLLTGGPGTGKSMIMGWLATVDVDAAVNPLRREINERITAVHFCRANDRSSITPLAFADRVANQLVQQVVGFDEALIKALEPYGVKIVVKQTSDYVEAGATVTGVEIEQLYLAGLTAADPFDISFIQPLQKLYQNGYDQPMLILVDALDEAWSGQEQGQNLVRALAQLDGLPKQVKLLITTRPDPRVTMFFEGARQFDLVKNASDVTDIYDFAEDWLLGQQWSQGDAKRVAEQIDKAAKGIFLYAHMVLRDVIPVWEDAEDAEKVLDLPDGLSGLYNNFFNREVGADRKRWHEKLKPLLGIIAVAQGAGVELEKLELLLGWEPSYELEICQQYLTGSFPDGPFHLFHQSLAEFLLEERDKNKHYRIEAQEMHQRFTNPYQLDNNWDKIDTYDQWHLPFHARNAGVLEALAAKTAFWIDCKPAAVRDSLETYSNLPDDSQAVAAIFALAYPALLNEESMIRAAILHASAIRQASQMAATFFEPVLERSPWRALWAHTRSLVIPYRNRKTVGRVKALTGAVVNDRLYVVTLERTTDQFKQQLSVWAPVEDKVRTTTITVPINETPELRVINAGTESYIEIRDSSAGTQSVILVTFEGLDQIFTGWNYAIAIWKVDNSIYSLEVDFGGAVYLRQLSSPPFYLQEGNTLKRSPETIHEMPIAQLETRPDWLLPVAAESATPALVAVDIEYRLTILFPQSTHRRTVLTKLEPARGNLKLKEVTLAGVSAFLVLSSACSVLLVDLEGKLLEKITYHDMEEMSSALHQRDVSCIVLGDSAFLLVANQQNEILFWDLNAHRFLCKHLFEQLEAVDTVNFQEKTFLLTGHDTSTRVWEAHQFIETQTDAFIEEVLLTTAAEMEENAVVAALAWVDERKSMRLTVRDIQTGDLLYEYERFDRQYRPHFLALCQTSDGPYVVLQSNWWSDIIEFHQLFGDNEIFTVSTESGLVLGTGGTLMQTHKPWWPEQFSRGNFTVMSWTHTQTNPSRALEAFVKQVFSDVPDLNEFWEGDPNRVVIDPVGKMLAAIDYGFHNEQETIVAWGLLFIREQEKPTIMTLEKQGYDIFAAIVYDGDYYAVAVDTTPSLMLWHAKPDTFIYNVEPEILLQSDTYKPVLALGVVGEQLFVAVEQKDEVLVIPISKGNIRNHLHIPERATALSFAPYDRLIVGTHDGILAFKLGCALEEAR